MRKTLPAIGLVAATVLAGVTAAPRPAQAYVVFGFGAPFFYGPPVYYPPPPVYYAPPVFYAPPPYAPPAPYAPVASSAGPRCYAGLYVCPVARPGPIGAPCSCPSNSGRQPGTLH